MSHAFHKVTHAISHAVHQVAAPVQHIVSQVTAPVENLVGKVPIIGPAVNHITDEIIKHGNALAEDPIKEISHDVSNVAHQAGALGTRVYHNVGSIGESIGHGIEHAVNGIGHAFKAPAVGEQQAAAIPDNTADSAAAPNVAVPKAEVGNEETSSSAKKKTARSGKKSLTVARSTGTGVNV